MKIVMNGMAALLLAIVLVSCSAPMPTSEEQQPERRSQPPTAWEEGFMHLEGANRVVEGLPRIQKAIAPQDVEEK